MQVKQAKVLQKQELLLKEIKNKYENVFSSPDGQIVLADILLSGMINRCSHSTDYGTLARDDGKRELAEHVRFMASPQPEAILEKTEYKS